VKLNIPYFIGWSFFAVWARIVFRVKFTGRENVPKRGPVLLASNHISYYDPPLVGCLLNRQLAYFAKKELFRNPVIGAILRKVNSLPVARGVVDRDALAAATFALRSGLGLVLFPEGTRSRTGEFLRPKAGVGLIARQVECPVVPVYVHGSNRLTDCFRGREKLRVAYGKPLSVDWIRSQPPGKEGYRKIAAEIMNRIGRLKQVLTVPDSQD